VFGERILEKRLFWTFLEHKVKKTAKYQKSKLEIQGDGVKTKSLTASDMENNLP
jgi:hypothetical protein